MRNGEPDRRPKPLRRADAAKVSAAHTLQRESLPCSEKQENKDKRMQPLFFKDKFHLNNNIPVFFSSILLTYPAEQKNTIPSKPVDRQESYLYTVAAIYYQIML